MFTESHLRQLRLKVFFYFQYVTCKLSVKFVAGKLSPYRAVKRRDDGLLLESFQKLALISTAFSQCQIYCFTLHREIAKGALPPMRHPSTFLTST